MYSVDDMKKKIIDDLACFSDYIDAGEYLITCAETKSGTSIWMFRMSDIDKHARIAAEAINAGGDCNSIISQIVKTIDVITPRDIAKAVLQVRLKTTEVCHVGA